jgi:hypothetical protein
VRRRGVIGLDSELELGPSGEQFYCYILGGALHFGPVLLFPQNIVYALLAVSQISRSQHSPPFMNMAHSMRSVHEVGEQLNLAMCTVRQAKRMNLVSKNSIMITGMINKSKCRMSRVCSLGEIFRFAQKIRTRLIDRVGNSTLIVCAGQNNNTILNTVLAMGAFMLMYEKIAFEKVKEVFTPILQRFASQHGQTSHFPENISITDCWLALFHARFRSSSTQPPSESKPLSYSFSLSYVDYLCRMQASWMG